MPLSFSAQQSSARRIGEEMKRSYISRACILVLVSVAISAAPPVADAACDRSGVSLQILGSGGPLGSGRASSGYVVWIDGVSRVMVDAGGGTFVRFHDSGAEIDELEVLALSHFHPDHAADLPALFWLRRPDLVIAGPSGNSGYPSLHEFLKALFDPTDGAFKIIGQYLDTKAVMVDVSAANPTEVYSDGHLHVRGIGVPHGDVPTIGIRVDVGEASIAFASDQIGTNAAFTRLITNVDVLVAHFAVSEDAEGRMIELHAKPSIWGKMAKDAKVGRLVLSHIMGETKGRPDLTGFSLDTNVKHVQGAFDGTIVLAKDLMCIPIG